MSPLTQPPRRRFSDVQCFALQLPKLFEALISFVSELVSHCHGTRANAILLEGVSAWLKDEVVSGPVSVPRLQLRVIGACNLGICPVAQVVPRKKDGWQTAFCLCAGGFSMPQKTCSDERLQKLAALKQLMHNLLLFRS